MYISANWSNIHRKNKTQQVSVHIFIVNFKLAAVFTMKSFDPWYYQCVFKI